MGTTSASHAATQQTMTAGGFPWRFFALAFGFTWLVCLPGVLAARGIETVAVPAVALAAVAQLGPSLAAFLLVYRSDGKAGVRRLLKRAVDFRIPLSWLLVTLLLPPVLAGGALGLHVATGGQAPPMPLLSQPVAILPYFIFIFFLSGPVPEEFGWRAYALDRLQARWNALTAGLVLGVIWSVWHLPLFFMEGHPNSFLPLWAFLLNVVAGSVLMTWLYNSTAGNLLVALLYHAMTNLAIALFPPVALERGSDTSGFVVLTALNILAAAVVVVAWGPRTLSGNEATAS